mmetsp:Transcript_89675/g.254248  ORF Transcript_89675/g.254248 Transcript_89675/m.254248 type:complete len:302 (-) Transcript_89675:3-908(-)
MCCWRASGVLDAFRCFGAVLRGDCVRRWLHEVCRAGSGRAGSGGPEPAPPPSLPPPAPQQQHQQNQGHPPLGAAQRVPPPRLRGAPRQRPPPGPRLRLVVEHGAPRHEARQPVGLDHDEAQGPAEHVGLLQLLDEAEHGAEVSGAGQVDEDGGEALEARARRAAEGGGALPQLLLQPQESPHVLRIQRPEDDVRPGQLLLQRQYPGARDPVDADAPRGHLARHCRRGPPGAAQLEGGVAKPQLVLGDLAVVLDVLRHPHPDVRADREVPGVVLVPVLRRALPQHGAPRCPAAPRHAGGRAD